MHDIYFEENYGKLYEKIEKGKSLVFELKSDLGHIRHLFIKREIPIRINDTTYYDLITPYGYGGPTIMNCQSNKRKQLVEEFEQAFSEYCREQNIISEFIRFHPILRNAQDFKEIYDVSYIRNTVGTTINKNEDPIQSEFSKSTRKTIRRVLEAGLKYRIIQNPNKIHKFKEVYYATMDRNKASEYYYFDDEYFNKCLDMFNENIILIEVTYNDKVIASAFYFVYGQLIHAHLSGTLPEYLHLSPAYIIKYATAIWARENNIHLIHYGGGITNDKEDSLYKFKKKFTKETEFEFFTGKKIWNKEVYIGLCQYQQVNTKSNYFPAYREMI